MGSGIIVIGAGGHAKVVVATLLAAGDEVEIVLDDDDEKWGHNLMGQKITGPIDRAVDMSGQCIPAIGDNRIRKDLVRRLKGHVTWAKCIHPTAVVHSSVEIGEGTVVLAGVVVQPDTRVGRYAILNTSSSIDHDGRIADFVHVAPGVHAAGDVELGEGVLMGVGSVAVPGVRIGAWCIIGAGAVVTQDLAPGLTAVGVPARPAHRQTS